VLSQYIRFCMSRVMLLKHYGVEPIMVFDGASLPIKSGTNSARRTSRQACHQQGHMQTATCAEKCFSGLLNSVFHSDLLPGMKHLREGNRGAALDAFRKSTSGVTSPFGSTIGDVLP